MKILIQNIIRKENILRYKDYLLNILSSVIMTCATQLVVYPFLGRHITKEEYGSLLTIMGLINFIGVALGNPLNNVRILMQREYDDNNLVGDFNFLFLHAFYILIPVIFIGSYFIYQSFSMNFIWILIGALVMFRAYYSAGYRIWINYKKVLIISIVTLFGYIIGIWFVILGGHWTITFLLGELSAAIYLVFTCKIIKEPIKKTMLYKKSLRKYIFFLLATVVSTALTYADRFFIYPVLGAAFVSIYNTASFLGKTIGIIMSPISGVLLTYYAKETNLTLKGFYKRLIYYFIAVVLCYIVILLFGPFIVKLLYPTLLLDAKYYMPVANLATLIAILGNTISPTMIRYCSEKWQPIIQVIYFISYMIFGIIFMKIWGLIGYSVSITLVNIIKVCIMVIITTRELKKIEMFKGENIT